jgi:hypothetical protein
MHCHLVYGADILLRLAANIARVPDQAWAQGLLEEVLTLMLNQKPVAAFTRIHAVEWSARAKAAIGERMAEIGATDRAKELIEMALRDTANIAEPNVRWGPLGILAESLRKVTDRAWVERIIRRLLSGQMVQAGRADAQLYASLAEQLLVAAEAQPAISEMVNLMVAIMVDLSEKLQTEEVQGDYDLKESLTSDIQQIISRLAALLPEFDDKNKAKEVLPTVWSLALKIGDLEIRRDVITKILAAWIVLDSKQAEMVVHEIEPAWNMVVANAALAKLLGERGKMEEAIATIDNVFEQTKELTWGEGLASALEAWQISP